MSYNKDYIITTLSSSIRERGTHSSSSYRVTSPIIPTGRIRNVLGGSPYTAVTGDPPSGTFPFGSICYSGDWVPGKVGNYGLNFDGSNDHILIGSTSDFAWMHGKGDVNAFKWSVSFWMKLDSSPADINNLKIILSTNNTTAGAGVTIAYDDRGTGAGGQDRAILLLIYNADNANIASLEKANDYPNDTNWHHVVVTFDRSLESNNAVIYIDGAFKCQGDDTTNTPSNAVSLQKLTIGETAAGAGGFNYPGTLDDLAIWNVVLTNADAAILYASGVGQPASYMSASNLVSYWNMEEGPGNSTIANYSAAISGTLNGTMTSMDAGTACPNPIGG